MPPGEEAARRELPGTGRRLGWGPGRSPVRVVIRRPHLGPSTPPDAGPPCPCPCQCNFAPTTVVARTAQLGWEHASERRRIGRIERAGGGRVRVSAAASAAEPTRRCSYSVNFSCAAIAAPTMPALLSSWAGFTGVRTSSSGTHFSAFLLTPPPSTNRSGVNSFSTCRRYRCTRLAHCFQDRPSLSLAAEDAFFSASCPSSSRCPSSVLGT